ncbi:MAG: hypothetical protein R6V17_03290, partial [Halanaerobacter sp.]
VITGGVIISQKAAVNLSDRMRLVQAGNDMQRYLKGDIISAPQVEIPNKSTLIVKENDMIIAQYQFDAAKNVIEYKIREGGSLEQKTSFPKAKCKIDDAEFEFLSEDDGVIKVRVKFIKKTASKKKNNILTEEIESIIRERKMGLVSN